MNINKKYKWVIAAWTIICTIGLLQYLLTEFFEPEEITAYEILVYPLIRYFCGLAGIFAIIIPGYLYLNKLNRRIKYIGFVLLGFVFCLTYLILFILTIRVFGPNEVEMSIVQSLIESGLYSFSYIATYFIMAVSILYTFDHLESKVIEIDKRREAENLLEKAKVQILKNQLQPHFLFNALNSVVSIIPDKKKQAQDMIVEISDLLRASLYNDLGKPIPIKEELQTLDLFVSIEKRRYDDQLEVIYSVSDVAKEGLILPFVFQPLVENAIKHGFKRNTNKLTIEVVVSKQAEDLSVLVKNNGSSLLVVNKGIGLNNLIARLENHYKDGYKFSIYQEGNWVINKLIIYNTHD